MLSLHGSTNLHKLISSKNEKATKHAHFRCRQSSMASPRDRCRGLLLGLCAGDRNGGSPNYPQIEMSSHVIWLNTIYFADSRMSMPDQGIV